MRWYGNAARHFIAGDIDFDANTIRGALVTSAYTPDQAHEFWSTSVEANEASGTGYTAGGQALTTKTVTFTAANTYATTWAASTAYTAGDLVRPTTGNGHLYVCTVGGTSAASEPTWPTTRGGNVTDGGVTWDEVGAGYVSIDSDQVQWTSSSITARYLVLYVDGATPGTDDYLLGYEDFGSNQTSTSANFTVTPDATGWLRQYVTFS